MSLSYTDHFTGEHVSIPDQRDETDPDWYELPYDHEQGETGYEGDALAPADYVPTLIEYAPGCYTTADNYEASLAYYNKYVRVAK